MAVILGAAPVEGDGLVEPAIDELPVAAEAESEVELILMDPDPAPAVVPEVGAVVTVVCVSI